MSGHCMNSFAQSPETIDVRIVRLGIQVSSQSDSRVIHDYVLIVVCQQDGQVGV